MSLENIARLAKDAKKFKEIESINYSQYHCQTLTDSMLTCICHLINHVSLTTDHACCLI